jgi:tRNA threonylcarbamoyl adenosine modification protein YjeE
MMTFFMVLFPDCLEQLGLTQNSPCKLCHVKMMIPKSSFSVLFTCDELMTACPFQNQFPIFSLEEMKQLAVQVASGVGCGDVIALNGALGVGKTTFSQFFCEALGITEGVNSPTFSLINQYQTGSYPVLHADLYRLAEKSHQLAGELIETMEAGDSLVLVEWSCYGDFLDEWITVTVEFEFLPETSSLLDTEPASVGRLVKISAVKPLPCLSL